MYANHCLVAATHFLFWLRALPFWATRSVAVVLFPYPATHTSFLGYALCGYDKISFSGYAHFLFGLCALRLCRSMPHTPRSILLATSHLTSLLTYSHIKKPLVYVSSLYAPFRMLTLSPRPILRNGCEVAQTTIYQVKTAAQYPAQARCVTLPSCNRRNFLKIISRHTTHPNLCLTGDVVGCFATSSKPATLAAQDSLRTLHLVPLHATTRLITNTR